MGFRPVIFLAVLLFVGCKTTEPEQTLIGPDLNGSNWQGLYLNTAGVAENVSAKVSHEGDTIRIVTNREKGERAHRFIGVINDKGQVKVLDYADGRKWTSTYGPASLHNLKIAVSEHEPNDPPLDILDLNR